MAADPQVVGHAKEAINDIAALGPHAIIVGVLCIIGGLFLVFAGYRFFRPTLFLAGFVLMAMIGYVILTRAEPADGYPHRDTVLLVGSLLIGLVGGALAVCLYHVGICLGALGGAALALFILGWHSDGVIQSSTGRAIFVAVLALIGAVVVHFFEKIAIMLATSILGAYLVILGIDEFASTGFIDTVRLFMSGPNRYNFSAVHPTGPVFGLLISMVVLALVGFIVQYKAYGSHTFFK
ncbi:hypothetical protein BASA81_017243 [Batrachochytrium salamandrivorans]|nr:hypothetical protein BASA81_017243 [Batrachochytrium salamandrivorans]